MTWVLVAAGVVVLAALLGYNRLVRLRNRAQAAWHDVDVYLRRRHDLVPNLVATVRAYAEHERALLESVTGARTGAVASERAGRPDEVAASEDRLDRAVHDLLAVAEAYPELKADARFAELQRELAATENKIAFSRQLYNDTVEAYRRATQRFPLLLMARAFGFVPPPFFSAPAAARAAPSVGE